MILMPVDFWNIFSKIPALQKIVMQAATLSDVALKKWRFRSG